MANYLCVDIGGTSIKYAKFNQEGKRVGELKSCVTPISDGANQIMPALIRIVEQEKTDVAGICVLRGCCGFCERQNYLCWLHDS